MHHITKIAGALSLGVALAQSASAATLLSPNGTVALGVNPEGHLNTSDPYGYAINAGILGVTSIGLGDATSPGCQCEGWGVSASGESGYANVSVDGIVNLTVDSFVTDDAGAPGGSFATSKTSLTSLPGLKVTQHYAISASGQLFQNTVTIENATGGDLTDVRYVRVMDWDVPPTEFFEWVTIQGTGTTADLERSHNNGFNTANPLGGDGSLNPATEDVDFVDVGPSDHGAYFRFNFGTLADGESKTFSIFYGAADDEAAALAALGTVGAELYSLGQRNVSNPLTGANAPGNSHTTFIFGFKGVGGIIIVPPPTGVPDTGSTFALLGLAVVGLGAARRFLPRA